MEEVVRRLVVLETLIERLTAQDSSRAASSRVYNTADITLTTAVALALTFNTERWDDASFHSTSVNTSRFTIPRAGRYLIGASIVIASNATGYRELYLQIDGSTRIADVLFDAANGNSTRLVVETVYEFTAAQYVEAWAFQNSGGNLNVTAAGNYSPEFWIVGPL